jgi:hypothetical protein
MALVNTNYEFLFIDIGTNGRVSDVGVFMKTALCAAINDGSLNLPTPAPLPGDDQVVSYAFVADEAFPLRKHIMKPFPFRRLEFEERIYNYRLSRARRVVENAFGILANRFRVFLRPLMITPERAEYVVLAACSLHNMLRVHAPSAWLALLDKEDPLTHELTPGMWRTDDTMHALTAMKGNNATNAAKAQRLYLKDYFNSPYGSVEWQNRMV